jgi:WD40 repeat protein
MKRILFLSPVVLFLVACVSSLPVTVRPTTAKETLIIATLGATSHPLPLDEAPPTLVATQIPLPTQPPLPTFNPRPQGTSIIDLAPPLPTALLSLSVIGPENAQMLNPVKILDNRRGQEIQFTQDGGKLLVLQDVLRVWKMPQQTALGELPIQTNMYSPFIVSPDGRILVIGNYSTVGDLQFWSLATAQMVREYRGGEQVRHLSFNQAGELLAVGREDGSVTILDVKSGGKVGGIAGGGLGCEGAAFNPLAGQLAVSNNTAAIDIWDSALRQIQFSLSIPNSEATCRISEIEYSPNGEVLAASMFWEKQIALWENGKYITTLTHSNSGTIWKISWSPNGRLLAVVENSGPDNPNQIVLWDVQNKAVARILENYGSNAIFSPDGQLLLTQEEESGAIVILGISPEP